MKKFCLATFLFVFFLGYHQNAASSSVQKRDYNNFFWGELFYPILYDDIEEVKDIEKNDALEIKPKEQKDESSKGYDVAVENISSHKKESFKIDVNVTSTVPVTVSMQGDKVIIEQVGKTSSGQMITTDEIINIDLKKLGKSRKYSIYKVPSWPFRATYYEDSDIVQLDSRYKFSTKSYSSSGHDQDITQLAFGESSIYIKNILLAAKLIDDSILEDNSGDDATDDYLTTMADQLIDFDGGVYEILGSINYSRHFINNTLSLGLQIPLVFKKHDIKLKTDLLSAVVAKIEESSSFQDSYQHDFEAFFSDILYEKGMSFNKKDTEQGIGDISVFVNYEVPTKHCERFVTGLCFVFPTAKERDTGKLWDPELGNGGFTEMSLFGSILFSKKRFLNPHCFAQATYNFAANVKRRVPKTRSYSGATIGNLGHILAMGELVSPSNSQAFSELDTTIRGFATEAKRIKISKGSELNIKVGNIFERFIFKNGFGDLFYDLCLKGRDYIGRRNPGDLFNPAILTHNTFKVSHKACFNFSYQFDEQFRMDFGCYYTFAGRNVAKEIEAKFVIGMEF